MTRNEGYRQRADGEPYGLLCGLLLPTLRPGRPQTIHVDHVIPPMGGTTLTTC